MRVVALFVVVLPLAGCSRGEAAEPTPPETGLFEPIASVVMHPRCINCHQDESPRQTDEKIVHRPFVVRGKDDHGAPTQPCQTCHQATNTADGFVPGVTTWRLAPLSMLWEGKTKAEICEQMWAWDPGAARTMPPLSHAQFLEALEAWVKADMPCPPRRDR